MIWDQNPERGIRFLCSRKYHNSSGAQPPVQWVPEAPSSEIKRPRREVNHSPLPSAVVKNEWSYTVIPPYLFSVSGEGQISIFKFSNMGLACVVELLQASSYSHSQVNSPAFYKPPVTILWSK
jgi:hypothetical protein